MRFLPVASVLLKNLTVKLKIYLGSLLRAEDQGELTAFKDCLRIKVMTKSCEVKLRPV